LASGLCPGPLGQFTALPQVPVAALGKGKGGEGYRKGRREDGKGKREWKGSEKEK